MPYEDFFDAAGHRITFQEILELCKQSYTIGTTDRDVTIAGTTCAIEAREVGAFIGYAAYKIRKPGGWTALVYRGTDQIRDWTLNNVPGAVSNIPPPQYGAGRDMAKQHGTGCILVGHSLGGGIASYAAAQQGMHAATIFPAPINPIWLALPWPPWPARGTRVQNYVCRGEVLTVAATLAPHMTRIGTDVWIQSNASGPIDKHALDAIRV